MTCNDLFRFHHSKWRNDDQCKKDPNVTDKLPVDVIATFTTTDNVRIRDMIERLSGVDFTGSFFNFNDKST